MRGGIGACLAAALLSLTSCAKSEVSGATVVHTTASGVDLNGTYLRPSSSERQPTLLLLHETGATHSRRDFDPIWDTLVQAGFGLVAPDLRGHGRSDSVADIDALAYDPSGYPEDVRGWLQFISDRDDDGDPVDRSAVGVLGFGTSASLAAAALGKGYVACAVAVSPSITEINALQGGFLRSGEIPSDTGGEPNPEDPVILTDNVTLHSTLWMTSSSDEPSATDGSVLLSASGDPSELHEETGAFHGAELMLLSESNQHAMVQWCLNVL